MAKQHRKTGRRRDLSTLAAGLLMVFSALAASAQEQPSTVAAGVPLHITLTHTAKMRVGTPVVGVLTEPVWAYDKLVFPKGSVVHGQVTALESMHGEDRTKALLNGDFTPEHSPVIDFSTIQLGGLAVPLETEARVRQTETVHFVPKAHTPLWKRPLALVQEKVKSVHDTVLGPSKKERAERLLFNQLPYHPQRIWQGTEMIADLRQPATVELAVAPVRAHLQNASLETTLVTTMPRDMVVHARLTSALDSDVSHHGDAARAVVTEPVFGPNHELLLPEGAELEGTVLQAKRSRSFGRNGALHFAFRGVRQQGGELQHVNGMVTGAEGSTEANLTVDAEGNVKAQPDKNRFLAPLALLVLASAGHDEDGGVGKQVVAANGFGLVARVVTLAASSPAVASGFGAYGFAKSVYFRFLTRGHSVTFPQDTELEVQLSER